ncbi:UDP-glucuronate:xylan alpha-glucuronosyltransferase 1 [Linum perenne]
MDLIGDSHSEILFSPEANRGTRPIGQGTWLACTCSCLQRTSATGNNSTLFNSGVMVIEPSNCTFNLLMDHINEIQSYNGGDQGYLNEIFTWWHRVPKHLNFLKNFWIGDNEEVKRKKVELFGADPSILYVLHYLRMKPWWRVSRRDAGAAAAVLLLKSKQKAQLEWDRREAEKGNFSDGHWKIRESLAFGGPNPGNGRKLVQLFYLIKGLLTYFCH